MSIDITVGSGIVNAPSLADYNFSLTLQEIPVVESGEVAQDVQDSDGILRQYTEATVRYDAQVVLNLINARSELKVFFSSKDVSKATVDANTGYVTTVGSGLVDIFADSAFVTRKVTHNARTDTGDFYNSFFSYVDGSLGSALFNATLNILDGTESRNKLLFTTYNNSTFTYVRNPGVWTGDLDWTGVDAYNSTGGNQRGGMLISPRHFLMANHYHISNGALVVFVDNDNNVITRTMGDSLQIAGTDLRVGILDSDVPEEIAFYRVFPSNWNSYLKYREYIGIVVSDQENKALTQDWKTFKTDLGDTIIHVPSMDSPKSEVTEQLVGGDSSSPVFAILNGEMIAMGTHFGANVCPFVSYYHADVNTAMSTLGGGYQLTDVDLSSFPTY